VGHATHIAKMRKEYKISVKKSYDRLSINRRKSQINGLCRYELEFHQFNQVIILVNVEGDACMKVSTGHRMRVNLRNIPI